MIDFKDEVPHSNDILYYITETVDAQGNKAYRIELATEVTPGTPMNKVLFDSIKTDLTNLSNNKQDKIVTGAFTMSTTTQTINLGFKPKAVIINSGATRVGNQFISSETEIVTTERPTYIYENSTQSVTLEIVNNGFRVTKNSGMMDAESTGTGYRYIAFR